MEPLDTADKGLKIADKGIKLLDRFPLAALCMLELGAIVFLILWVKSVQAEKDAIMATSLKDKQTIIETQSKVIETQEKRAGEQAELSKLQSEKIEVLKEAGGRR